MAGGITTGRYAFAWALGAALCFAAPALGNAPDGGVRLGKLILFSACTPEDGCELWKSDGTADGTRLVKDIYDGPPSSNPDEMARAGKWVFFRADDGVAGVELWRSDGTKAGTKRVENINPGASGPPPEDLAGLRGRVYFGAFEPEEGRALGERRHEGGHEAAQEYRPGLRQLAGRRGIRPPGPVRRRRQQHGRELWKTDGTRRGTRRCRNISPGTRGSFPEDFATLAGARTSRPATTRTVTSSGAPTGPGPGRSW